MIPVSIVEIESGISDPIVSKKSTILSDSVIVSTLISLGFYIDTLSIATEGHVSQSGIFDPLGFALGGLISRELFGPEPHVTPTLKSTILGIIEVDVTGDQPPSPIERKSIIISQILIDGEQGEQSILTETESTRIYTSADIELPIQSVPAIRRRTRVSVVSIEV